MRHKMVQISFFKYNHGNMFLNKNSFLKIFKIFIACSNLGEKLKQTIVTWMNVKNVYLCERGLRLGRNVESQPDWKAHPWNTSWDVSGNSSINEISTQPFKVITYCISPLLILYKRGKKSVSLLNWYNLPVGSSHASSCLKKSPSHLRTWRTPCPEQHAF